jgi:hypothetical protein
VSRADITETCSCGATLRVVMDSLNYAQDTADKWRRDHRHEFPPTATLEVAAEPDPERHDTTLDAYVERTNHHEADPANEMDRRTIRTTPGCNPIGYRP